MGELDVPNPEPAKAAYEPSDMVRRDVTTKATIELGGAYGNDYVRGGTEQDDVYGTLGNDWLEGNENEDAIVGDMGKIVDNVLGQDDAIDPVDPAQQFIVPQQPFLGSTINQTGVLKREVELYAFNQIASPATAGIGHDVALGGDGNDWIHTGPGEDLANGNAGDDRIFLGDNFTATTAGKTGVKLAHDRVDAGWGGFGYDHVWGGYGADYSDVRPRKAGRGPGPLPDQRPGDVVPDRRRRTDPGLPAAGAAGALAQRGQLRARQRQLRRQGLPLRRLGPGHAAGQHRRQRPAHRRPDARLGRQLQRLLPLPVDLRRLGLDAGDRARPDRRSCSRCRRATARPTTATTASGFRETAIVFANEVKDNTKPIHADTPAHFTCGPGTTGP